MPVLTVGLGQEFATLSAAIAASQDGDVIQVQAGTYTDDFAVINTKITIEGVGGMVHLVAATSPPNGKAILVTNTDVTLSNLEFSGAQVPDGNGASWSAIQAATSAHTVSPSRSRSTMCQPFG